MSDIVKKPNDDALKARNDANICSYTPSRGFGIFSIIVTRAHLYRAMKG